MDGGPDQVAAANGQQPRQRPPVTERAGAWAKERAWPWLLKRWRGVLYWVFVLSVYATLVAYHLRWRQAGQADLNEFTAKHYFVEVQKYESTNRNVEHPPPFRRPLGWITQLQAVRSAVPQPAGGGEIRYKYDVGINWPILGLLTLAYLTSAWAFLYAVNLLGTSFGANDYKGLPGVETAKGPKLSWAVYAADIDNAQKFAQQLDRRSVLFLAIGTVVAVMGLTAIILVFPQEVRTGETTPQLILRMARPIGLTVFIEAIAWHFLRQSRVLIEDQRSYYRMYLKRANYLAALGLLPESHEEAPELTASVLWSMLHDPVSDRMGQGETTEAIQMMQALNSEPPFTALVKSMAGQRVSGEGNP